MVENQQNSKRLAEVDYAALIQQARQKRARYLAVLFKQGLSVVGDEIKRTLSVSISPGRKIKANREFQLLKKF